MALKYVDDIGRIITEQLDIEKVVGERVRLKRAGRNLKGLCPFHEEKTPSFVVSSERQSYHCFGCGVGGNAIGFVMETEHLDFITAIETLAERYSINLDPYLNQDASYRKPENVDQYYEMNKQAARVFYDNLKKDPEARKYLHERGISDTTIAKYGIGLAKDSWNDLYNRMKHLDHELIQRSGLFSESKGRTFDRFRNRIIFPIIDLRRRVVAFGGRVFHGEKEAKYLNSPDTPVFNKSYHLYGLNLAKNTKSETLHLVEGYMDVISLYQRGITTAVASLGTAFTSEQAKLLAKYASTVTILYDGDEAGVKATLKAMEILLAEGLEVYVVTMKEGEDPDSLVQSLGKEGFLAFIEENKRDAWGYQLMLLAERYDISKFHGKSQYLQQAKALLEQMPSRAVQEVYMSQISEELGVSTASLRADLSELKKFQKEERDDPQMKLPYKRLLLGVAMRYPDVSQSMTKHPSFKYIHPQIKEILCFIADHNGYNIELATQTFGIDTLKSMDEISRLPLKQSDYSHWKVLFNELLKDEITYKIAHVTKDDSLDGAERLAKLMEYQQALQHIKE